MTDPVSSVDPIPSCGSLVLAKSYLGDGSFHQGWFLDRRGIVLVTWIVPAGGSGTLPRLTLTAIRHGKMVRRTTRHPVARDAIADRCRAFLDDLEAPETENGL